MKRFLQTWLLVMAMVAAPVAAATDVDDLTAMLHEFLSGSDKAAAHEKFWADDLVYSSSAGLRFGKADIMEGFDSADAEEQSSPPSVVYSATDVDVRVYGDAAVVAFKLVGTPVDPDAAGDVLYYFNTGTFLKRDGTWRVVAWQATKIPPDE